MTNTVTFDRKDPYALAAGQERISLPLTKPLKDYTPVYQAVPLHLVDQALKNAKQRYNLSPLDFLEKEATPYEKVHIYANAVDGEKCFKLMKTWRWRGMIAGGIVGGGLYLVFKPGFKGAEVILSVATGATVGGVLGNFYGKRQAMKLEKKMLELYIVRTNEFNNWRKAATKEQYEILVAALNNYGKTKDKEHTKIKICPISLSIPIIPVRAPDGQTYDKDSIESHLDNVWPRVQAVIDANPSEKRLNETLSTISPIRGQFFHKSDLYYDHEFAEEMIKELAPIIANLERDPAHDHILLAGLKALKTSYKNQYRNINNRIIANIAQDALIIGATEEQRDALVDSLAEFYLKE